MWDFFPACIILMLEKLWNQFSLGVSIKVGCGKIYHGAKTQGNPSCHWCHWLEEAQQRSREVNDLMCSNQVWKQELLCHVFKNELETQYAILINLLLIWPKDAKKKATIWREIFRKSGYWCITWNLFAVLLGKPQVDIDIILQALRIT